MTALTTKRSSDALVVPEVVTTTAHGASNDDKVGIMAILGFISVLTMTSIMT